MKLNQIKSYFLATLLVAGLSSCGDEFLDRPPQDQRVIDNFYQTESDAAEALIAIYDAMGWNTTAQEGFQPLPMITDILSDDSYAGGASRTDVPPIVDMDQHRILTTNPQVRGLWRKYYVCIFRANIFLERIEGIDASPEFTSRAKAEAKFVRAYAYFDLLRLFENVPLILETLSPEELDQPQASPQEVYDQIAKDLVEAAADLPESVPTSEAGRVSKWAAKSLLGRALLYVNGVYGGGMDAGSVMVDQAYALAELEDVIANGGFGLLANFEDNFKRDFEFSNESVFEISYSDARTWFDWGFIQGGEGNMAAQMQGPRIQNPDVEDYEAGWSFAPVTQDLYDAFEENDPRRDATILMETELNGGLNIGFQHTGYFSQKYTTSKEYVRAEGQLELNWGNNYRVIRFSDVLLMAAELGSANAQQYLDQVRARVGLASVPATPENIMQERRVELALEGHRYWDLLRQGVNVANQAISITNERGDLYQGDQLDFNVSFNPATLGFFPIPQSEIDLSGGVYQQNAGY